MKSFFEELTEALLAQDFDEKGIESLKKKLCKKHSIKKIPTNIEIMLHAEEKQLALLKKKLLTKPVRSIAGVAPVAIMSHPFKCPHGSCTFCPSYTENGIPSSYTGKEPATMRGLRNKFDAYLQVMNRLEQYIVLGHNPEKVEIIVMGGTFPSFDETYQKDFVCDAFKAMNDFSVMFFDKHKKLDIVKFKDFFMLPGDINSKDRRKKLLEKIKKLKEKNNDSLEAAQKKNETTVIRCVALCIETKPDWCMQKHIDLCLELGMTRLELGVQTIKDNVLQKTNRGHTLEETKKAIQLLKDNFVKITYHMMLGLPSCTKKDDLEGMKEIFESDEYKPDALKIYPCMVMPETPLYNDFKKGNFTPISTEESADSIAQAFKIIPPYCRVMRVQRDIPTYMTEAGVDKTNLRQYVNKKLKEKKIIPKDIRSREPGRKKITNYGIKVYEYSSGGGKEFFISAEDEKTDTLIGFCRLRFPHLICRPEITKESAGIRELHVYGTALGIGDEGESMQHQGIGAQLMKKAEEIAKEHGKKKILVISGIGVRAYYSKKLGYRKEGVYMSKFL